MAERGSRWTWTSISATTAAAAMMAQQVAAKSTRDTLFLSHFDVSRWPAMLAWASIVSIAVAFASTRAMARWGPGRLMPAACLVSGALLLGIAFLAVGNPSAAAVALYLHVATFGPVLISGYWSMFNERFDPRTAKREIARIGGTGTLGGLLGGLLANRIAAGAGVAAMLPVLAGLHLVCAVALNGMGNDAGRPASPPGSDDAGSMFSGLRLLLRRSYLRNLGLLVLLVTVSAVLLDYVFRSYATRAFSGDELMQVFSWFHTGAALLAFLVQITLSRLSLDRVKLAETVATLPIAVAAGSLAVLAFPSLLTAAIARGIEMVLSNSIFRSGFELLFTPVPPIEKRATKAMIDVAVSRAGDAVGAGVTLAVLALAVGYEKVVLLVLAALLASLGLVVALRLHRGYVRALESSLRAGAVSSGSAVSLDMSQAIDTGMFPLSMMLGDSAATPRAPASSVPAARSDPAARSAPAARSDPAARSAPASRSDPAARPAPHETMAPASPPSAADAALALHREQDLRSGDPSRVLGALAGPEPLAPELVPHVIPLLGEDALASEVTRALRSVAPRVVGQLVDALLDPERPIDVRRRIPRILSACPSVRSVEGLLRGLDDVRFRVRMQCGWALARIREKAPEVPIDRARLLAAVEREVDLEKHVWGGRREMERLEDASDSPFVDDYVRERANASLQHVFTLLSIALAEQMLLRMAFNGLHSDDPRRRGTALEYLDCVLPPEVRDRLWPFLEERGGARRAARTREEIIADLVDTNESMRISIAELRKLQGGG